MSTDKNVDLFEHPDLIPDEIQAVLHTFDENADEYKELARLAKECEALGYTFDYYLDATPYDLRKIGTRTVIYAVDYNFEVVEITKVVKCSYNYAWQIIDEMYENGLPADEIIENYDAITFDNENDCNEWLKKHYLSECISLLLLIKNQ